MTARVIIALAACAAAFEHEQRACPGDQPTNVSDTIFKERVVVFDEAMGARVVVAGDINKDGRNDLVVASSTDNAIRWFENLGDQGWSRPQKITYDAKGARVVALADIDGDGYLDVVYASYYDNTVGWFKNSLRTDMEDRRRLFVSMREFNSDEPRYISRTVDEGQGVVVADLDGDGDPDVATASSSDSVRKSKLRRRAPSTRRHPRSHVGSTSGVEAHSFIHRWRRVDSLVREPRRGSVL